MGISGSHQMPRMLGFHVVIVAVLGFAMSIARGELPEPNVATFDVDGLTLSMPIDVFRQLYPEAEVTETAEVRYCHGEKVKIESLSRLGAVIRPTCQNFTARIDSLMDFFRRTVACVGIANSSSSIKANRS